MSLNTAHLYLSLYFVQRAPLPPCRLQFRSKSNSTYSVSPKHSINAPLPPKLARSLISQPALDVIQFLV